MGFLLIVGGLFAPAWVPVVLVLHRLENTPKGRQLQFSLKWLLLVMAAEAVALAVAIQSYRIIQVIAARDPGAFN